MLAVCFYLFTIIVVLQNTYAWSYYVACAKGQAPFIFSYFFILCFSGRQHYLFMHNWHCLAFSEWSLACFTSTFLVVSLLCGSFSLRPQKLKCAHTLVFKCMFSFLSESAIEKRVCTVHGVKYQRKLSPHHTFIVADEHTVNIPADCPEFAHFGSFYDLIHVASTFAKVHSVHRNVLKALNSVPVQDCKKETVIVSVTVQEANTTSMASYILIGAYAMTPESPTSLFSKAPPIQLPICCLSISAVPSLLNLKIIIINKVHMYPIKDLCLGQT